MCSIGKAYKAAFSRGIFVSYTKKAAIIKIEIISGARTLADFHPSAEPDVKAYMNRTKAIVIVETPMTSKDLNLAKREADEDCVELELVALCDG